RRTSCPSPSPPPLPPHAALPFCRPPPRRRAVWRLAAGARRLPVGQPVDAGAGAGAGRAVAGGPRRLAARPRRGGARKPDAHHRRSEEHTSELQSLTNLVFRLLLA